MASQTTRNLDPKIDGRRRVREIQVVHVQLAVTRKDSDQGTVACLQRSGREHHLLQVSELRIGGPEPEPLRLEVSG